jgi:SpoVK/Ycf46/Vps4 family AAA+-type ATPase
MKKAHSLLLAAVIFFAMPQVGLAGENANQRSFSWGQTAINALSDLYYYFTSNMPQDSFNPYIYAMNKALHYKQLSWDNWFAQAAEQLVSYVRTPVINRPFKNLSSAIDLFVLVVAGAPKKLYVEYLAKLQAFEAEARTILLGHNKQKKIDYYLDKIIEKAGGKDAQGEILRIIYDQLKKNQAGLAKQYSMEQREVYDIIEATEMALKQLQEKERSVKQKEDVALVSSEQKKITFKDYIDAPQAALDFVNQIKHPEKYAKFSTSLPNGLLLTGDPGTGKTYLARAIAGELDCPFFAYAATDLMPKKYGGTGVEAVNRAFESAREEAEKAGKKIAIIFIDELDAVGSRSNPEEVGKWATVETVNTLLTQLDGFEQQKVKVIVIAATNHPERIDPALLRSGRIDTKIHITYSGIEGRKKLLEMSLNKTFVNKDIDKNDFVARLVEVTEGLSPADITALVANAGKIASNRKKGDSGIDYDCVVRALWDIKKTNYEKQLATRPEKEHLIKRYLDAYGLKILPSDLLVYMEAMTLNDIKEIFEKFSEYRNRQYSPEVLTKLLMRAIAMQNQVITINKNREAITLCEKIYAPLKIQDYNYPEKIIDYTKEQKEALLKLQPEDIFNRFEAMAHIKSVADVAPIVMPQMSEKFDEDEMPVLMQPHEQQFEEDTMPLAMQPIDVPVVPKMIPDINAVENEEGWDTETPVVQDEI